MTAVEPGLAENICCISYFVSLVPYHVGGDWILVKMIFYHFLLEIWKSILYIDLKCPSTFYFGLSLSFRFSFLLYSF